MAPTIRASLNDGHAETASPKRPQLSWCCPISWLFLWNLRFPFVCYRVHVCMLANLNGTVLVLIKFAVILDNSFKTTLCPISWQFLWNLRFSFVCHRVHVCMLANLSGAVLVWLHHPVGPFRLGPSRLGPFLWGGFGNPDSLVRPFRWGPFRLGPFWLRPFRSGAVLTRNLRFPISPQQSGAAANFGDLVKFGDPNVYNTCIWIRMWRHFHVSSNHAVARQQTAVNIDLRH